MQLRRRLDPGNLRRRFREQQHRRLVGCRALSGVSEPRGLEIDPELAADLGALRDGAAVVEGVADLLELAGPDRLRLLNGLVTADVKSLASGSLTRGFFTTGQGRILADFRLLAEEDRCVLILPAGSGEGLRVHLEKYKVASRVEISQVSDRRLFEFLGPRAHEVTVTLPSAGDGGDRVGADARDGSSVRLLKATLAEDTLSEWLREGARYGLRRVSSAAVEIDRVEKGELRFGIDFSSENFPQETGRDADVSYAKGCYLGQEVVARIHYRGGVQRLARGLRFNAAPPPAAGTELLLDGRAVGRATSVVQSPRFGAIGLGLLHQRGSAPGTLLEVAARGDSAPALVAEVVELPLRSLENGEAG